jgi:hypothetical protein
MGREIFGAGAIASRQVVAKKREIIISKSISRRSDLKAKL